MKKLRSRSLNLNEIGTDAICRRFRCMSPLSTQVQARVLGCESLGGLVVAHLLWEAF